MEAQLNDSTVQWSESLNEEAQSAVEQAGLTVLIERLRVNCEHLILHTPPPSDADGSYCNATFDGWGCWNYTKAGVEATLLCSNTALAGLQPYHNALATKKCENNGSWFVHPLSNTPFSNYTACVTHPLQADLIFMNDFIPLYIFFTGFAISIVMLLISLVIFFAFRQLRCERITVHKNLFASYLLTGVTWILYYLVTLNGKILVENPVWCQALHVAAQYSATCNFAWMFCEGLYLHVIMAHAFRTGKTLLRVLLFVGWVDPLILTIIYSAVRGVEKSNTESCWMHADATQWIINAPVVASVVVNILVLVNLVRLLVTKLRQVPDAPQSRKAVRATLILVPLLGIQFLAFPIQPEQGTPLYDFYHYFIALLTSLQGALVSVMYCFCNGEVTSLLRRKWHQHRLMTGHVRKNTALTSSTYTEGYSVVNSSVRDLPGPKGKVAPDQLNRAVAVSQANAVGGFVKEELVELKPLKSDRPDST